ncbi:MAG TPA: UMP kinase [Clostridia bacterium]|nr:UMP kinase [Clostridia bacterium]
MIKYKRISLKLSGEALGNAEVIDFAAARRIADEIKILVDAGVEVGVTLGGGNIWRGRSSGEMDRNRADQMGMLATVINSLAMEALLKEVGVPCKVLSATPMERVCDTYTSQRAEAAFAAGQVVLFAAGTGLPFFSTDTAAALKAAETGANALLLAKNVDGVYSADPKRDPSAVRYPHLTYDEVIARNLQATDITAVTLCRERGIPILIFAMREPGSILRAASGEDVGTLVDGSARIG